MGATDSPSRQVWITESVLGLYFETGVGIRNSPRQDIQPQLLEMRLELCVSASLPQLMGPTPTTSIVLHEREPEQEVSSDATNERVAHHTPDLDSTERESEVWNRGAVPVVPKRSLDGDRVSEGAYHTIPGTLRGECQCPGGKFFCQHLLVPERDSQDIAPSVISTVVNATMEPTNPAKELKAVLGITSAIHAKVCL